MKNARGILIYLIYTVLMVSGLIIINLTIPKIHPLSLTDFKIGQKEALRMAQKYVNPSVLSKNPKESVSYVVSKNFLDIGKQNGTVPLDTAALKTQQAWKITFLPRDLKGLDITVSGQGNVNLNDIQVYGYFIYISPKGRLLALDFEKIVQHYLEKKEEESALSSVDTSGQSNFRPEQTATNYLAQFGVDTSKVILVSKNSQPDSTENIYSYKYEETINHQTYFHELKFIRTSILSYRYSTAELPPAKKASSILSKVISFWNLFVFLLFAISLIVLIIRLSRKETISFRLAFPVVLLVLILLILQSVFIAEPFESWVYIVGTIFSILFQCAGILILYSVGEGFSRLVWPEKLVVTDQFYQKKFMSHESGKSVLRGILLGTISLSAYSLFIYFYHTRWNGGLELKGDEIYYTLSILPFLGLSAGFFKDAIFHEFFFRLFGLTLLKNWLGRNMWVLLTGGLLGVSFTISLGISDSLISLLSFLIPSFLFTFFLVRYEILTVIIGYFTFLLLSRAVVYVHTAETSFSQTGWGLIFILILLFGAGLLAAILKKERREKNSSFKPDYMRRKEEKERLIRELEIARTIQMQFLPKTTPQIKGFEIASSCQPAWEVGGDYYDFFEIDQNKLGIVIGDVSNKGVSAAFFMTLTKGFLKALARQYQEPVDILAETNRLFYENVERGYFISMIFAILDTERGDFHFSRAGHNPVLYFIGRTDEAKWITPPGVGIGLLPDHKFRETLRGEHILLKQGDMVVLFTDGFPEAMNEDLQEYGEERLQKLLNACRRQSAREITVSLEAEIVKWQGNRPSHDDRTLVVIKRNS